MNEMEKLARTIRVLIWILFWFIPIGIAVSYGYRAFNIETCGEAMISSGVRMAQAEAFMEICIRYGLTPTSD